MKNTTQSDFSTCMDIQNVKKMSFYAPHFFVVRLLPKNMSPEIDMKSELQFLKPNITTTVFRFDPFCIGKTFYVVLVDLN